MDRKLQDKQRQIGKILIDKGLITSRQLEEVLQEQRQTREFLGEILVRKNYIKEKELFQAISEQFDIPFVSLKDKYIDWGLARQFSASLIFDHKCFPLKKDNWTVTVAITNPLDVWAFKKAEEEARGLRLKRVLVSNQDMQEVIQRYREYLRGNITKLFK
ncbi:MAG: hypothetical protein NC908_03935 [Candidatus Omnitrophica bacterium]|nr:hypothetical protein [Candidatus Omnitrophota bacterium]